MLSHPAAESTRSGAHSAKNARQTGAPNTQQSGEKTMVGNDTTSSRVRIGQVGETTLNALTIRRVDGTEKVRPQVVRPDAVAVLPVRVTADGTREGLFVRQARPVVGESALWEVPAGKVDPNEHPTATAARELREETGYVLTGLAALATGLYVSPGYTTERMHIYAGTVAATRVEQRAEDAGIVAEWRPLDRMFSPDMKTVTAVLLAQRDAALWAEVMGR